jgi:hypothetical protein
MHLHHLTLTTGHSRRCERDEIDADALAATGDLLAAALAQGRAALPVQPAGIELEAHSQGRCLVCTVWHDEVPLVTFGVASHSRCGAGLWRMLAGMSGEQSATAQPQVPWCAVALHEGLTLVADATAWLGDLERCIAWAWLDEIEQR